MLYIPYIIFITLIAIIIFSALSKNKKMDNIITLKIIYFIIAVMIIFFSREIIEYILKNGILNTVINALKKPTLTMFIIIDLYFLFKLGSFGLFHIYYIDNKSDENIEIKMIEKFDTSIKAFSLIIIELTSSIIIYFLILIYYNNFLCKYIFIDALYCLTIVYIVAYILKNINMNLANKIYSYIMSKEALNIDNFKLTFIKNDKAVFKFNKIFFIGIISIYKYSITNKGLYSIIIISGIIIMDSFIDRIYSGLKECIGS